MLSENEFLQVHKSFTIATKHIQRIEVNRIYIADTVVPIGKLYKVNVNELLKKVWNYNLVKFIGNTIKSNL